MLKKQSRLSTRFEFNRTRKFGRRFNSRFFYLFCLAVPPYTGQSRFGFVASLHFDKGAVKRNRAKRLLREVFRNNFGRIKPGFWIVVYPKKEILGASYGEIDSEFNKDISKFPFAN